MERSLNNFATPMALSTRLFHWMKLFNVSYQRTGNTLQKSLPATILMTSHDRDFMNRVVTKIVEIDEGDIVTYSGNYDFYVRERAHARNESRSGVRAPAGDARQGAALHRPLRRARGEGRAGAEPREGARQNRERWSRRKSGRR